MAHERPSAGVCSRKTPGNHQSQAKRENAMKAAYIEQTGSPDCIIYGDLPQPEPVGSQVLVRVKAVSVNPIDTYLRNGANYWELPRPFILGCDLAGEVVGLGPQAGRWRIGDRVWGSNQGLLGRQGTFAQYCAPDECWLYPIPDGVSDAAAAACALVAITAHLGLFREARLEAGETLLVHGGSGGVGSMVVQMAKAVGARVLTTAGSQEKVRICQQLGADHVVNYHSEDLGTALQAFAPGARTWCGRRNASPISTSWSVTWPSGDGWC